jgi:hypothetical protein
VHRAGGEAGGAADAGLSRDRPNAKAPSGAFFHDHEKKVDSIPSTPSIPLRQLIYLKNSSGAIS